MNASDVLFISQPGQPSFIQLRNWGVANHSIDGGQGNSPDDFNLIKFDDNSNVSLTKCGNINPSPLFYNDISSIYAIVRANAVRCSPVYPFFPTTKINHGAIGVSLENNVSFNNGATYTIRYKIAATRSENFKMIM